MWKIEHRPYRLPFRAVVRTAHGPWAEREGFLLRVTPLGGAGEAAGATGKGSVVGWGEAAPIAWFGSETLDEAGEALVGLRGEAHDLADALARVPRGCVSVRAALAAAWRELGAAGVGEAGENIGAENARAVKFLSVAGLLPAGRAGLAAVEARLELGFRTFKWKVGVGEAADELAMLDDLLGALPAGAKLRLDANGAWDRRTAERWLAAAAERPMIEYVEQPCFTPGAAAGSEQVRRGDDLLRGLAADFPVKIALDESLVGADDVRKWLAAEWRGVWVLKPSLLGEAEPLLAQLEHVRADVVWGSALETAVGARAGLRLAFAWAERLPVESRRALGYGVWPLFTEARANASWTGPFLRRDDLERIDVEALWNALN